MLANAGPLPVKASGGVRTAEEAEKMIALGVKRIGTFGFSNCKRRKSNRRLLKTSIFLR